MGDAVQKSGGFLSKLASIGKTVVSAIGNAVISMAAIWVATQVVSKILDATIFRNQRIKERG